MTGHPDDWITITSGALTARINPLGAELSSLTDAGGRELMTDADPAFWTGRAPLLFPLVGKPAGEVIRVDGVEYPMTQHGFARRSRFELVDASADAVTFRLRDDAATRASYPFAFTLSAHFHVEGSTLDIAVRIDNPGDVPLPASFGFHPALAWPLPGGAPREDHRITFAADEPAPLKRLVDGLIAGERPSPLQGRTLSLSDALFIDDALIWDHVRSQAVTYGTDTGPRLAITFPDTPQLGVWSKPGARFVCVEPWHGLADPVGYAGEFRDKPGVFMVPPGGAKRIGMSVTLVN